jgi:hypothetical protein
MQEIYFSLEIFQGFFVFDFFLFLLAFWNTLAHGRMAGRIAPFRYFILQHHRASLWRFLPSSRFLSFFLAWISFRCTTLTS